MAAGNGTYVYAPPPPLPEFYLSPASENKALSIAASHNDGKARPRKTAAIAVDGAYDGRSTTFTPFPPPILAIPPTSHTIPGYEVPPLAIYHICRVCLRTRSARYHKEHPIPVEGLPLPPGICRRCRVASVEELRNVTDVIVEGESNKIKLGFIAPFVRDEAIISNENMKQMRVDSFMERIIGEDMKESRSAHRISPGSRDIVYRHVDRRDGKKDAAPIRQTKVTFNKDQTSVIDSDQSPPPPRSRRVPRTTTSMQVHPSLKPIRPPKYKSYRVLEEQAVAKPSSESSSRSSSRSTIKARGQTTCPAPYERTDSTIRAIAREEVRRFHQDSLCPEKKTELVRQIARDEVERYRQAERIIAAHPDPYAHGKMVPKERRIARGQDAVDAKPSGESVQREKVPTTSNKPTESVSMHPSESRSVRLVPRYNDDEETLPKVATSSERQSRQEVSVERQESRSGSQKVSSIEQFRSDRQKRDNVSNARYDDLVNTMPSERVVQVPRSTSSKPANLDEPYASRLARSTPACTDDVVEVIEEWMEIPTFTGRGIGASSSDHPNWWSGLRYVDNARFGDHDRARKTAESPDNRASRSQSRSTRLANEDGWEGLSRVRTLDSRSSRLYETSGSGGTPQESAQTSTRRSERPLKPPVQAARSELPKNSSDDRTKWPDVDDAPSRSSHPASQRENTTPSSEIDSPNARIVRSTDTLTEQSVRSHPSRNQSNRNGDQEYVYSERTIKPAGVPGEPSPFHDRHRPRRIEVEEWVETRRYPMSDSRMSRQQLNADRERMDRHVREQLQEFAPESRATGAAYFSKGRSANHGNAPTRQGDTRSRSKRDNEDSIRVRFSNKVDYSPTPPDSDDSSSAFRSYYSIGRRSCIRNADGASSPEQRMELVGEADTRGRTASRVPGRKGVPSNGKNTLRGDRWNEHGRLKTDADMWEHDHRQLGRALSESPSRERSLSSINEDARYDSRGPYGVLGKPSESMQVEDGRPDGDVERGSKW